VRPWSAILLAIAAAAIAPQTTMSVGAGAVSVLLESLPYLAGAALCSRPIGPYASALVAYAGCGCAAGPSARSIPAAIATAAIFGLPVAIARLVAGSLLGRFGAHDPHETAFDLLDEVQSLAPAALLAAVVMTFAPLTPLHALPPVVVFVSGALLGAIASPCALGGVALAASLRASAPLAAMGALCTAGLFDVYVWRLPRIRDARDPWAYGLLALACALVAARAGGTFVHPRLVVPLALTALLCLMLAWRGRSQRARAPRIVVATMLAVIVIGAPAPVYRITETTLADGFPGERVDFTGVAVYQSHASALVRYAITCCRADAAPVVLALDRDLARFDGRWMHARGALESHDGALRLHVERLVPIIPPADPFVYR
jgi:hypothetical protein